MENVKIEKYNCVCGSAYKCEMEGCDNRAEWKYVLPQCTVLYCDKHKKQEEHTRTKYGFGKIEVVNG